MRLRGEEPSPQQVQQLIEQEVKLASGCDRIISVSEQEKQQFVTNGLSNTEVLGHALQIFPTLNTFGQRKDILFVGAIYEIDSPNADSVKWFAQDIFPKVQERLGQEIRLIIAGNNTVEQLIEEIGQLGNPSIQMLGKVDNLTRLYNNARLFVAPTRFAAGIPLKVYEAAAYGISIVTTSLIAKQLGWQHEVEILVADNPEKLAAECVKLYQDELLWQKLRSNALSRIQTEGSPSLFSEKLKSILT
ncbi:glycosyltransferase family 4 protein [Laspinema olomoucense]|uniref:glycosyltransferase family 4 protein n=1 Tax=Laspinema olomoucense TaxID=3231600 RepID=UPI0021BB85E7|nr:glycosyltransferase family 4 protein [Laspinema sp. D3a]MCT7989014.1 glycosyltransferase family 4 protein [Laspinema sp. D3a]